MCSQVCTRTGSNVHSHQFTQCWYSSEEEDNEVEVASFSGVKKRRSLPKDFYRDSMKTSPTPTARAKTERNSRVKGYSLAERMKERQRSSVVSREGEFLAQQYSKMMAADTLEHINHTVCVAGAIVNKGAHINEELSRQERVLGKAGDNMSIIEYDTELTAHSLKGMTSLRSKIASKISGQKPKKKVKDLSEMNFDMLIGQPGLCAFSRTGTYNSSITTKSSGLTQQDQIKAGFEKLHDALDVIKVQQLDTAWTLERQKGRFSGFEEKIGTTHEKINRQSILMNKIMSK